MCPCIRIACEGSCARSSGVCLETYKAFFESHTGPFGSQSFRCAESFVPERSQSRVHHSRKFSYHPTIASLTYSRGHQYFLRGPSVTLTRSLPGVNKKTILSISRAGDNLRELVLESFDKFQDILFASLFPNLPSLRVLVLR